MRKTIVLGAAVAILSAGAALADDLRRIELAPQSFGDVRNAGAGTVVGTVTAIDRRALVLDDGAGTIRVVTGRLDCSDIEPGQRATVVGRFKHDEFRAMQLIREDGSAAVTRRDRHRERHADRRGD